MFGIISYSEVKTKPYGAQWMFSPHHPNKQLLTLPYVNNYLIMVIYSIQGYRVFFISGYVRGTTMNLYTTP